MAKKTVVFNIQFDYRGLGQSGSSMRPNQMRMAFEQAGFKVLEVSGHRGERAEQVSKLLPGIKNLDPESTLLYAENATFPHYFDQRNNLPGPSPDIRLAKACAQVGIASGIFYRDMYWRYLKPKGLRARMIHALYKHFYKRELRAYADSYDVIYAPTLELMKPASEIQGTRLRTLPPGGPETMHEYAHRKPLSLVHVGGVTGADGVYDVSPAIYACLNAGWFFRLICRQGEWEKVKPHYPEMKTPLSVHHASGAEKDELLERSELASMLFTPHKYREAAFPYKMLEYLGAGLPIIASTPSEAARFVEEHGVGWVVEPYVEAIAQKLRDLEANPGEIEQARKRIPAVLKANTWDSRIKQIESDLWRP